MFVPPPRLGGNPSFAVNRTNRIPHSAHCVLILETMHLVAQELLRAIRHDRSQKAFSRRLGYRANPITDWENGRSFPRAEEMLRAASLARIDVPAAFLRFNPNIPLDVVEEGFALSAWMRATIGKTRISELARGMNCSRSSLSRCLAGKAEMRVPEFLGFVDCATGRLPDFVAELVPISRVPSMEHRHGVSQAAKRVAFDHPWTEALLRLLESSSYRASGSDERALAEALDVSTEVVRDALAALLSAELVTKRGRRYLPNRPLTVDTQGGRAALHRLKAHWTEVAATRAASPREGDVFAYNVLSASRADVDRIRDVLKNAYREIRAIVAASEPSETAALVNLQLLQWDLASTERRSGRVSKPEN